MDTLAVIADVHGNIWALEAVLEDIQNRHLDNIVNLGDSVYGPLDPGATARRLQQPHILSISGNMDRILHRGPELPSPTFDFVKHALAEDQIDWLRNLPDTLLLEDLFCCHGTPDSDETSLLEAITPTGVFLADTLHISKALERVAQPVILCGHTHVPRTVWLPDGRLVINPGSVGVPAYDDDKPYPHKMEAGSPHARYAVLSRTDRGWRVEHIAVPYDWETAADAAHQQGREDYVVALKYGRAESSYSSRA
jgi:putative phosphoesterase